jgi:cell division septal protein FtsQ
MSKSRLRATPKVFNQSIQFTKPSNKRNTYWRPILGLLTLVVVVLAIGRIPALRINQIILSGTTDSQVISKLDELKGHSLFSRDIARIVGEAKHQNTKLASLDCRRGIPRLLRCNATERTGQVIWQVKDSRYLTDGDGLVFALADSPSPDLITIEDRFSQTINLGSTVASKPIIDQYRQLAELLKRNSIGFDRLMLDETIYQVTVKLTSINVNETTTLKNLDVLFSLTNPLDGQVKSLVALINDRSGSINDHIDLRNPGYAYYK